MMGTGFRQKYEFKENDAWDFARSTGQQFTQKGRELVFRLCPYCHGGKSGERDKFSINLDTGAFNCMRSSCGAKGNMLTLARDFDFKLSGWNDAPVRKTYKKFPKPDKPIEPKEPAIAYLEKRGISKETAKRYEITVQNKNENILVFPFFDENGELQFIKYRKTDFDKTKDKNKEWCQQDGKPILFGMKQCEVGGKLIVTEGQMDSLSVAEVGVKNAVSVPTGANGFTWVPHCWDFMQKFDEIIVFGDYEHGKITLLDEIKKRFGGKVKHVREEDYKDCKDANEILLKYGKEQIKKCIDNAIYVPIDCVVNVADIESINPNNIEKLRTGISDVDRLLKGGLPFGYYHVITGRRGEGKSTLASQIIAEALNQGYSAFAYSGEMPVGHFKSWIDYQIAGVAHIRDKQNDDGSAGWYISKYDKEKISGWYRDRLYAYDSEMVTEDHRNILTTVDEVIRRYGVRVVLIDNLMTAVDLDENARANKYDSQGGFAKKLAEMARKYNVLILLVAHKRKTAGDYLETDPNDDIGGSSYVTNLCGDIIGYSRPTKKQVQNENYTPQDRVLTITKNRLFGNVNYDGWRVMFDEKSKRIYGDRDDVRRRFKWDNEVIANDGFMNVETKSDIPFE